MTAAESAARAALRGVELALLAVAAVWLALVAIAATVPLPKPGLVPGASNATLRELPVAPDEPWSILLLSDVQEGFAYLPRILADGARFRPNAVVVLGDLSSTDRHQHSALSARELTAHPSPAPLFVIPGNHDVWEDESMREFRERFGDDRFDFRVGHTRFLGLDNARGPVEPEEIDALRAALASAAQSGERVVLAFHRPLTEPTMANVRELARHSSVALALSGHEHESGEVVRDGIRVVVAPASGEVSKDTGHTPISYLVLHGSNSELELDLVQIPRSNWVDLKGTLLHLALIHVGPDFRERPWLAWGLSALSALLWLQWLARGVYRRRVPPKSRAEPAAPVSVVEERLPPLRPGRAALALLPMALALATSFLGAWDFDSNDQAKQASYSLDILANGNWILPFERGVLPATKPPLNAWLASAALSVAPDGSVAACRLPAAFAALGVALLLFAIGGERWRGADLGAPWLFAASHLALRMSTQVRPDMLLTFLITLAFFAVHRADLGRVRGTAVTFWAAFSLSLLAKGPVGALLILAPLAALSLDAGRRAALRPVLRSRWAGLLAVPALWALLAAATGGTIYLRDTVMVETVHRVLGSGPRAGRSSVPGVIIGKFLSQSAPWSLFALLTLPLLRDRRERAARLLPAAWLLVGLFVLSLSRGQRADYVLPLLPASSLLAASGLLRARSAAARAWPWLIGATGVGSAALGALAIGGASAALAQQLGPAWGLVLAGAGIALAITAFATRRDATTGLRLAPLAAAVVALLVIQLGYDTRLSPEARTSRWRDLRAFAERVKGEQRAGDRLYALGEVRNGLRFSLGLSKPSVSLKQLHWLRPAANGARALLIAGPEAWAGLEQTWPGRFRALATQEVEDEGSFALVEWLGTT